jgi:hypothetical protein
MDDDEKARRLIDAKGEIDDKDRCKVWYDLGWDLSRCKIIRGCRSLPDGRAECDPTNAALERLLLLSRQ